MLDSESADVLRDRLGTMSCQKVSLENKLAALQVEYAHLERQVRELEGKLARAGFEFIDLQSALERELMGVYQTLKMVDLVLGDRDVNGLRGLKIEPTTAYERAFVEICQAVDSCEFFKILKAEEAERESGLYAERL